MTDERLPQARAAGKWIPSHRQSRAIGEAKTEAGKRRAVLLWCRKVLKAIKGGGQ